MGLPASFAPRDDINQRILRATVAVTAAGVAVKAVATIKEFVVAATFGRSDAMDAFLTAALIPGLLVNLVAESMNQALIPNLVLARDSQGEEQARRLFSNALVWSSGLLLLASLAMTLTARWTFPLLAWQFSPAKLELAERLFFAQIIVILASGIASNCTAVLNSLERFALPALIPLATPLTIIFFSSCLSRRFGVWSLAYATVAGAAIQVWWAWKMLRARGFAPPLAWYGWDNFTRNTAARYLPVMLSSVVASGGLLIDQAMAAALPAGSVSALSYGGRFVSVIITLMGGAVATALTPYFSKMVAAENWTGCRDSLEKWAKIATLASLPLTLTLIVGSRFLVRLAFEHGAFTSRDSAVVAPVMALYAIQIPFFVCSRVHYRFLLALGRTDLIFYCGVLNLVLDLILNLVLMRMIGVAGIALATSLWTVSTLFYLQYWSRKLLRQRTEGPNASSSCPISPPL